MADLLAKSGWLDVHDPTESLEILRAMALTHATEAGPHANHLLGRLRNRDYRGLLEFDIVPSAPGQDPRELYHALQAVAFFKKLEWLDAGYDREGTCITTFLWAEDRCRLVNERFSLYRQGEPMDYPWDRLCIDARNEIRRVIGEKPPSLDQLDFKFGPGATTTTTQCESGAMYKLGAPLSASANLVRFPNRIRELLQEVPGLHDRAVSDGIIVTPSRFSFAPKNARTYRGIIVPPLLNSLFQQGYGRWLKRVLRTFSSSIDLYDQRRNQELAFRGSVSGGLATVDLKAASDTKAKQMVAFFLPSAWYAALETLTDDFVVMPDGQLVRQEKFSAMGCAFTFELESLIFWALTRAACRHLGLPLDDVSVFGDDIVMPSAAYELTVALLAFCGLTVNLEKSFWVGSFRESCGADWYNGYNVRPYYQKYLVSPATLFVLHNFYARSFDFRRAAEVRKFIHPDLQIWGPDGFGDGHLVGDWTPFSGYRVRDTHSRGGKRGKHSLAKLGWDRVAFHTFVAVPNEYRALTKGAYLLPTYSIYRRGDTEDAEGSCEPDLGENETPDWCHKKFFVSRGVQGYKKAVVLAPATQRIFSS